MAVFDPEPLKEIAQELFNQLPDVSAGRFDVVGQTLTAVDGSVVETLARPRSCRADRDREGHSPSQRRQDRRWKHRTELRWLPSNRDQPP